MTKFSFIVSIKQFRHTAYSLMLINIINSKCLQLLLISPSLLFIIYSSFFYSITLLFKFSVSTKSIFCFPSLVRFGCVPTIRYKNEEYKMDTMDILISASYLSFKSKLFFQIYNFFNLYI